MNQKLYDGFLKIESIDTELGKREICVRSNAVACLIYDDNYVLLTSQERVAPLYHQNKAIFFEVPAGMIDRNEHHAETLKREIFEEIGHELILSEVKYHGCFYPSPGGLSEKIYLYSNKVDDVTKLSIVPQSDKHEKINIHIVLRKNTTTEDMKTMLLLELTK